MRQAVTKAAMGRPPCCDRVGIKKGPWTPEEDIILVSYIQEHGPGNWRSVPTNTGNAFSASLAFLSWFVIMSWNVQTMASSTIIYTELFDFNGSFASIMETLSSLFLRRSNIIILHMPLTVPENCRLDEMQQEL